MSIKENGLKKLGALGAAALLMLSPFSANAITKTEKEMYERGKMSPGAYSYLMKLTYDYYLADQKSDRKLIDAEASRFRNNNYKKGDNSKYNKLISKMDKKPMKGDLTETQHYFRNELNLEYTYKQLEVLNQRLPNEERWKFVDTLASSYHMNGDIGTKNSKWVSADEHFEVVYDRKQKINRSESNMGTYNYYGLSDAKNHYKYDVAPYYKWGNTQESIKLDETIGFLKYNILDAGANLLKYYSGKAADKIIDSEKIANDIMDSNFERMNEKKKQRLQEKIEELNDRLNNEAYITEME